MAALNHGLGGLESAQPQAGGGKMSLIPERIKELDNQVKEIAAHLEWEFDQEYADRQERNWNYHAEIKNGNKVISFSTSDFTGKIRFIIRAVFPRDKKNQSWDGGYNTKRPEITVGRDRGPEKIAHAIQSRLLPEYEKQLVIALENIKKSDAYHAVRMETLKTIAEYFGLPTPEDDDKAIYPGMEKGVYKIEAASEGVKFDISTSVEKALQIFEILKKESEK
jgi:hypothetical protein